MKMSIDKAIRFALLAPFVAGMIIYGGGKPGPGQRPSRFFFDDYLSDIGSYSTNDIVHVASVKSSLQIPDDTPMHVYAALMGTTNWTELLPSRTYADQPADWTLADATNYDYIVMLDWVPPAPVVTNDILTVNALAAKGSTPPGKTLHAVLPRVALVTPIEYLESTGTQFIDTGIYPSSDMSFAFTAALASKVAGTSYSPAFFGGRINTSGGNGIPSWWNSENFWFYGWGNSNSTGGQIVMQFVVNRAYTFHIDRYGITIDGVKKSTLQNHTSIGSTRSIYLFNLNNNGTPDTRIAPFRIYNFAIYQNGVLVRDFIPVRVGRVGYLFDRVSGEYLPFGNKGTGAFILGPDITE